MPLLELALTGGSAFAAGVIAGRCSKPASGAKRRVKSAAQFFRTPEAFQVRGREDAVVIVDPLSTGARLAFEAQERGYKVIRVLSTVFPEKALSLVPEACQDLTWAATIQYEGNAADTAKEIQALPFHIVAFLIGCESGVECFDAVTDVMPGFPSNGLALSGARRDKYLMGEAVRNAGLRAVKQSECRAWEGDAKTFVASLGVRETDTSGPWCVLKPTKSAGTDGVFIAKCALDAQRCFDKILGAANVFGESNQTVLVQEFLKGKEYVVDSVTHESKHKCVAIWEYDKRPCNGAQFVYFGMRIYQTADGVRESRMVDYVHKVLDALGVRHGPSHAEVMWLDGEDAPCLVEVGCRPHGGEGTFVDLAEPIVGYSQVSVILDAFDKPYRFHRLPQLPAPFPGLAIEVCLVSREEGQLAGYPLAKQVQQLRSFKSLEAKVAVGGRLERTVDFLTTPGSVMILHQDRAVVEADYEWIHRMQEEGKYFALTDPLLVAARCAPSPFDRGATP